MVEVPLLGKGRKPGVQLSIPVKAAFSSPSRHSSQLQTQSAPLQPLSMPRHPFLLSSASSQTRGSNCLMPLTMQLGQVSFLSHLRDSVSSSVKW